MHLLFVNILYYLTYLYLLSLVWVTTPNTQTPRQKKIITLVVAALVGLPPLPIFLTKIWTLFGLQGVAKGPLLFILSVLNVMTTVIYLGGLKRLAGGKYVGIKYVVKNKPTPTKPRIPSTLALAITIQMTLILGILIVL